MSAPADRFAGATGTLFNLLPPGEERDTMLGLIRLGITMRLQQGGKRPEYLRRYITELVATMPKKATFNDLLDELSLCAARRDLYGVLASPIEKVDRVWEVLTYWHPKRGRIQVQFESLENTLTKAKSSLAVSDDQRLKE